MSISTNIEWASFTASPWFGCSRVSPGCVNCYAEDLLTTRLERIMRTAYKKAGFEDWEGRPVWGPQATRVLTKNFWTDVPKWNRAAAELKEPPRLFPSMDDWLDDMPAGIIDQEGSKLDPIEVLARLLTMIHDTPNLDHLLLTKRPENFQKRMSAAWSYLASQQGGPTVANWVRDWIDPGFKSPPPPNVWIGTSVENQEYADKRIPELLKIRARVRFLSIEPLLSLLRFNKASWLFAEEDMDPTGQFRTDPITGKRQLSVRVPKSAKPLIHWVIVGGESGPRARPCDVDWIRSIVEQCKAAGIGCFVKQFGSNVVSVDLGQTYDGKIVPIRFAHKKGGDPSEWPAELRVREFPITE